MTLPEALPSYTCARARSILPGITGSLSHLWNSFKTRFGTSVLPIASASITDALVPRTGASTVEFTGPASFIPALLPQTEPQRRSYATTIWTSRFENVISFYKKRDDNSYMEKENSGSRNKLSSDSSDQMYLNKKEVIILIIWKKMAVQEISFFSLIPQVKWI